MARRLEGKSALITAAAQGVGRASAEAFAREGASVIAAGIDMEKLGPLKNVEGITILRLDVRDAAAIAALPGQTGAIDILFNVAGFVHSGTVLDATGDKWDFASDLNVRSMFRMIKAFLPGMLAKGKGSILTVQTPSLEDRLHATGNYEAARAAFIARQKMGRLGRPEEIAELAAYLASDAAGFTAAQAHIIDGGMTM